jgi:hypothetical protein
MQLKPEASTKSGRPIPEPASKDNQAAIRRVIDVSNLLVSENIDSYIAKHRLAGTVRQVGRVPYDEWVREHCIKDSRGPSERFRWAAGQVQARPGRTFAIS